MVVSIAIFSEKTFIFDFKFSSNETVLLKDDFDSQGNWRLRSKLRIDSGYLISDGDFQIASLKLAKLGISPLDPSNGAINLYWRGIFPEDATKPRNTYILGLEYAENSPFCWNGKVGQDVKIILTEDASPCPKSFSQVRENPELRAWIRPKEPTIPGFIRLHIDPDFTPGVQPEERDGSKFPYVTLDSQPNSQREYRMRVQEKNQQVEVELFFFKDDKWESLGESLVVAPSQWKHVIGQNEETGDYIYGMKEAITFKAVNILLRRDRNKEPTKIDAVALTQEKISR
ncbi:MAG: hypothetical protein F6K18_05105 [Okeania sp. SIO2C2]|nr:hypothetical protein [Okeania sp. SIO1H5]NEP86250.1 hypothetical protein [Okeania sp. SIO2C2]NES75380.1 hypothetical protein [Okeania sp. SIO1H4]NES90066.1 hypothetical protein [Okeania sp. SIO2B9]